MVCRQRRSGRTAVCDSGRPERCCSRLRRTLCRLGRRSAPLVCLCVRVSVLLEGHAVCARASRVTRGHPRCVASAHTSLNWTRTLVRRGRSRWPAKQATHLPAARPRQAVLEEASGGLSAEGHLVPPGCLILLHTSLFIPPALITTIPVSICFIFRLSSCQVFIYLSIFIAPKGEI